MSPQGLLAVRDVPVYYEYFTASISAAHAQTFLI